jgi:hypothetical protein
VFKNCRTFITDEEQSVHKSVQTTEGNIELVHSLAVDSRRATVYKVPNQLWISLNSAMKLFTKDLISVKSV